MKSIAICILNYNSSGDTIECIDSILKHENIIDITIFVLDNGSKKDQKEILEEYLKTKLSKKFKKEILTLESLMKKDVSKNDIVLIESEENFGFAKGNNIIINYVLSKPYEYIVLLNNDTVLEMNVIGYLVDFLKTNNTYSIASCKIMYYSNKNKVWNAGGRLFFGNRRYYTNKKVNQFNKKHISILPVTFITGCFMVMSASTFKQIGFFTERFFFGEEDFEFCLRVRKKKLKMCVILDKCIYHKVNSSTKKFLMDLGATFCFHLNRYINMKSYYSPAKFIIWALISNVYIFAKLIKKGYKIKETIWYLRSLNKLTLSYKNINRELFFKLQKCRCINEIKKLYYDASV